MSSAFKFKIFPSFLLIFALCPAVSGAARVESGYHITDNENCGGLPLLGIGTADGYCAGLAASSKQGLEFPRGIVQIPGSEDFIVTDMGGWVEKRGRILRLVKSGNGYQLRTVFKGLTMPHGIRVGLDSKIYVGTPTSIYRFDPKQSSPKLEVVINNLPGRNFVFEGQNISNVHPLTEFVFDKNGDLFVNVGAPSDNCLSYKNGTQEKRTCKLGEGPKANGAIWRYPAPSNRLFKSLRPGEASPRHEVYARGLRNSMALALHPQTRKLFQAENSRDLKDPNQPFEELNLIERGKHYGWPYCYNMNSDSAEYKNLMKNGALKNFCKTQAQPPISLVAPHAAPLGMTFYQGRRFPELNGGLIMAWHGHQPTGNRIMYYPFDQNGLPKRSHDELTYQVDCELSGPRAATTTSTAGLPQAQPLPIIDEWYEIKGLRPEGAPVGVTVASDGSLWLVEDKNKTIIRIDRTHERIKENLPSCYQEDEIVEQSAESLVFDALVDDPTNWPRFQNLSRNYFSKHCTTCHSGFGVHPEMSQDEKEQTMAQFLLADSSWIVPGFAEKSKVHQRTWGKGNEKIMPDDGHELLKQSSYRALLDELDKWINNLGQLGEISLETSSHLNIRNADKKVCGQIPNGEQVLVRGRGQGEMRKYFEIFENREQYLNGQCSTQDRLFVGDCCVK